MNFRTDKSPFNMPELTWYLGYPLCWAVMTAIALVMLGFFWKRGWIGARRPSPPTESQPPKE